MSAGTRRKQSRPYTSFTIRPMTPEQRYQARIQSMVLAITEHDWHAVMDAAADIRELVAAHPELRKHEARLWSRK